MRNLSWLAGVLAIVCALGGAARAQGSAKELFEKANAHFAVGEFERAGEYYQEAYKLKPDPALLYNAAQAYRLAGRHDKALVLYKNYVLFYPDQKNIPSVKQQIAALQKVIADSEKAKTAPPTSTERPKQSEPAPPRPAAVEPKPEPPPPAPAVEPKPEPPAPRPAAVEPKPEPPPPAPAEPRVEPQPAPAAVVTTPATGGDHRPVYKKWWFWTALVGGAVVVAGVATAVALTTETGTWETVPPIGPGRGAALVTW